jgi:hypothetical protein
LKARSQPLSRNSLAVTHQAFKEADEAVHAEVVRWLKLRRYFMDCFVLADARLPRVATDFIFGYVAKKDDMLPLRRFSDPKFVELLRQGYTQVEKEFFL